MARESESERVKTVGMQVVVIEVRLAEGAEGANLSTPPLLPDWANPTMLHSSIFIPYMQPTACFASLPITGQH
jgi:hypothetical protein